MCIIFPPTPDLITASGASVTATATAIAAAESKTWPSPYPCSSLRGEKWRRLLEGCTWRSLPLPRLLTLLTFLVSALPPLHLLLLYSSKKSNQSPHLFLSTFLPFSFWLFVFCSVRSVICVYRSVLCLLFFFSGSLCFLFVDFGWSMVELI